MMNSKYKAAVAALAFAAFVAQPITAHATVTVQQGFNGWHALWGVGFVLCAGVTMIHQDAAANASGVPVTDRARVRALVHCAFPPLGFALLHHYKAGYDR